MAVFLNLVLPVESPTHEMSAYTKNFAYRFLAECYLLSGLLETTLSHPDAQLPELVFFVIAEFEVSGAHFFYCF